MDVIETAIRNAFEKGNADDKAFREKVYRSAFAALDRALKANPAVTVEAAISRRKGLQAKIAEIESEFIPAIPGYDRVAAPSAPMSESSAREPAADFGNGTPAVEPDLRSNDAASAPRPDSVHVEPVRTGPRAEPVFVDTAVGMEHADRDPGLSGAPARQVAAEPPDPAVLSERRRPFGKLFIAATVLAFVGIGGWWGAQTGLFKTPAEIDTSVPNPPPTIVDEDFDPDEEEIGAPAKPGEADAQRNWVTVFTPSDPSLVNAPGDTRAEVMQDDSGSFLRIRSGAEGSAIIFDVGQGILEQLAGKKAVFDIVARAEEGQETQISVNCNFGELGDCGRKRYAVGYEKGEFLFEIDLPAKQPGAGGTIAINSDVAGGGKAIDIYEIRASATP